MNYDVALERLRRRLHREIDAKVEAERAVDAARAASHQAWLRARAAFYGRSVGQINRHNKRKAP